MIKVIYKELYNTKVLVLETPIPTPSMDKIKITISKPGLLNINPKPITVTQLIFTTNLTPIVKSKKLPNPLIFDRN